MLSMKSMLKNTINGKDYVFMCDPDSPIADAIESNAQFGSFLAGKQVQANQQQAPQVEAVQEPTTQE